LFEDEDEDEDEDAGIDAGMTSSFCVRLLLSVLVYVSTRHENACLMYINRADRKQIRGRVKPIDLRHTREQPPRDHVRSRHARREPQGLSLGTRCSCRHGSAAGAPMPRSEPAAEPVEPVAPHEVVPMNPSPPLGASDSSTGALALPIALTALLAALLLAPGCIIVADGGDGWDDDDDFWGDCVDPACTGEIVDSDGDGIADDDEGACNFDMNNADSDFDGTLDCDEDLDGDGYSTAEELAFGSDCANGNDSPDGDEGEGEEGEGEEGEGEGEEEPPPPPDTDGDGATDEEEANRGTDPNNADSDGDGQCDGAEIECGSSPLDPFFTCT
jgi:hypothetical protein